MLKNRVGFAKRNMPSTPTGKFLVNEFLGGCWRRKQTEHQEPPHFKETSFSPYRKLFCLGSSYFNLNMITLRKKALLLFIIHFLIWSKRSNTHFTFISCSSYMFLNILRQLSCLIFAELSPSCPGHTHTVVMWQWALPLGKLNLNSTPRQSISVTVCMCLIGRLWTESESHVSKKLVWISVFGDERKNP